MVTEPGGIDRPRLVLSTTTEKPGVGAFFVGGKPAVSFAKIELGRPVLWGVRDQKTDIFESTHRNPSRRSGFFRTQVEIRSRFRAVAKMSVFTIVKKNACKIWRVRDSMTPESFWILTIRPIGASQAPNSHHSGLFATPTEIDFLLWGKMGNRG